MEINMETSEEMTNSAAEVHRLRTWSKDELISQIQSLQKSVEELKKAVEKKEQIERGCDFKSKHGKGCKIQRPFDFSKHNVRHVALKIAYLGWDYQGNWSSLIDCCLFLVS